MNKQVLSILVENTAGVLSRVSGLFSRRGYSIDSISAGVTKNPSYTRMTVVCNGDALILEQITRQVEKLEDVLSVKVLEDGQSVRRELMLVKVRVLPDQRPGVTTIVDIFRGNIIDVSKDSMIIEVTGDKSKLEAFLDLLQEPALPVFPEDRKEFFIRFRKRMNKVIRDFIPNIHDVRTEFLN